MIEVVSPLRHFVDISLSFSPHPLTGDIPVLRDDRAINASIKNCVMIAVGEKPFNHGFGSIVSRSLFEMCDEITASEISDEIYRTIGLNEPRVDEVDVFVKVIPENNEYQVEVKYKIIGFNEVFNFETLLRSTR